jgi:hypothetical protein
MAVATRRDAFVSGCSYTANQLSLRFGVQTTVVRLGSVAELATGKQCD